MFSESFARRGQFAQLVECMGHTHTLDRLECTGSASSLWPAHSLDNLWGSGEGQNLKVHDPV